MADIKAMKPEECVVFDYCDSSFSGSKEDILKGAAQIVLDKLKECPLFCGKFDGKNGNIDFMYGVSTVMESIANYAQDMKFEDMFIENMTRSRNERSE